MPGADSAVTIRPGGEPTALDSRLWAQTLRGFLEQLEPMNVVDGNTPSTTSCFAAKKPAGKGKIPLQWWETMIYYLSVKFHAYPPA